MKNFLLTLVLAVASVAAFAQMQNITVYNSTNSPIFVQLTVINVNTCLPAGSVNITVPPRQSVVAPAPFPGNPNYAWSVITALSFPSGDGITSYSPCINGCLVAADNSTGLGANWDISANCNYVTIF